MIHSIFKNSASTYLLSTFYVPGNNGIVRDIYGLFRIKENPTKQLQTEECLAKKLLEKKPKSEQTTKKCSYAALRVRKYCFLEI